jgi:hypothetical protein
MIRRGFWLAAGAMLGVAGYHKAARLARTITAGPAVPRVLTTAARGIAARSIAARSIDARAMEGRAMEARATEARAIQTRAAVPLTHRVREAACFARDVRDGMAEYRDLHRRQLSRRLGSRSSGPPDDRAPASRGGSQGSIQP